MASSKGLLAGGSSMYPARTMSSDGHHPVRDGACRCQRALSRAAFASLLFFLNFSRRLAARPMVRLCLSPPCMTPCHHLNPPSTPVPDPLPCPTDLPTNPTLTGHLLLALWAQQLIRAASHTYCTPMPVSSVVAVVHGVRLGFKACSTCGALPIFCVWCE